MIEPPPEVLAARVRAELLFESSLVVKAIDQLAVRLTVALGEANPVLLCVMNGALPFTAALLQRLQFPLQLDYVRVSRYRGTEGRDLRWHAKPDTPLEHRNVLIIDDILDEGVTLAALHDWVHESGAASCRVAVLLDKDRNVDRSVAADFVALHCPDRYVFGWGMDFDGYWRNLPDIYAMPEGTSG